MTQEGNYWLSIALIGIGLFVTGCTSPPSGRPLPEKVGDGSLSTSRDTAYDDKLTDTELEAAVMLTLPKAGIDVESVEVADGRAKGGERVLIIAFTSASPRTARMLEELTTVVSTGHVLNEKYEAAIDSTVAIAGDHIGAAVATATVDSVDSERLTKGEISGIEFVRRWTWGPGWKWTPPDDSDKGNEITGVGQTPLQGQSVEPTPQGPHLALKGIVRGDTALAVVIRFRDFESEKLFVTVGDKIESVGESWEVISIGEDSVTLQSSKGKKHVLRLGAD